MAKTLKNHPYINIGGTTVLAKEDVLGVFDLDTASTETDTKRYLASLEQAKRLVNVASDLPKTFAVVSKGIREQAYMTSLSSASLYGRWKRQSKYL